MINLKSIQKLLSLGTLILFSFNGNAQEVLKMERVEGFANNGRVEDIVVNDDDEIWVASNTGIFSIGDKQSASTQRIDMQDAVAVIESKKGIIYSAFKNNTIYSNYSKIFRIESDIVIEGEKRVEITDMELHKSELWVSSSDGIFVFNTNTQRLKKHIHPGNSKLNTNQVNFLHTDQEGQLWIGTGKGLIKVKKDKWKVEDKKHAYTAVSEIDEGMFFVNDVDIMFRRTDGVWNDLGLDKGLAIGDVNDIALDADNYLYIASDILVRYDPYNDKLEEYTDALGIVSSKCLSLASDSNNNLWLGTSDAGLFRIYVGDLDLDALEVLALVEDEIKCPGEATASILLNISGGEGPYEYSWDNLMVKGSNPTKLKAGSYSVTVSDVHDHLVVSTVVISEPKAIEVNDFVMTRVTGPGRKDGSCELDIIGGIPPYEVMWENGEKGIKAQRLQSGFHNLTITDQNACETLFAVEILKEKFIPELDITKIEVGQTLKINNLFFEADSSAISHTSTEVLDEIYEFLNENKNVVIEIGGHTNNSPPHEYCDKLSTSRASNVASYLYDNGIALDRITYKGYGKRKPKYSNKSIDGKRRNQRVEIKILQIK